MKKIFKRALVVLLILVLLTAGLSVAITSLFGNKIGDRLVTAINEQIDSELVVEDFDFSLLRSFPNISANLRNVIIKDNQDAILIEAEKLAFNLGIIGLIRSKIDIKSVLLSKGNAYIKIDRRGKGNYDIFKETPDEPAEDTSKTYEIAFDRAMLEDFGIQYANEASKQHVKLWIENSIFSGAFGDNLFDLNTQVSFLSHSIIQDGQRYLSGIDGAIEGAVQVDLENQKYELEDLIFSLGKNSFDISGFIEQKNEESYLDLTLENESGNLASLLQLLPKDQIPGIEQISSSGNFAVNASIKGLLAKNVQPSIKANISLDRGKINTPHLKKPFKDVTLSAVFSNGRRQNNATTFFEIQKLEGYFGRKLLEGNFRYENLDNPNINLFVNGILPMDAIYGAFGQERITNGSGEIELKDIVLKGLLKDIQNPNRFARVESSGALQFEEASLTVRGEELTLDKGFLSLRDKLLKASDLSFKGAGSEIDFEGSAFNVIPVLFADEENSKRVELEFDANLKAKSIDFDRLMAITAVDSSDASLTRTELDSMKTAHVKKRETITNFLKGSFNAVIDEYNFNKIEGKTFTGKVEFINNEMDITGSTETMEGTIKIDGKVFFEAAPSMKTKLEFEKININQLFVQTENLGQDVLVADNIKGDLNAKAVIYANWTENGDFVEDKFRILAGVGMEDGQLKDFKLLQQFSSFVKIQDLMNIKFSNLQNFLEYRRKRLYLPVMFIQSNAMNLTISGEHTYDNEMRYNFKVNAGQILANKFKKFNPELKPLKARKQGFFNLYYMIYGNADNYEIKSAKRRIKEDFELSSIRKRELMLALEKEFGYVTLVEEPMEWRDIPEYEDEEAGEEEYLDFEEVKRDTVGNK